MKTKLTLSIDRREVAMLRKTCARKGKSISQLVEDLANQLDEQKNDEPTVVAEPGILKWAGYLADKLTPRISRRTAGAGPSCARRSITSA
jgi:hypothetical protein